MAIENTFTDTILMCILLYGIIQMIPLSLKLTLEIFNPIRNYKEWKNLNWIGVILGTIILYILYLPYAIIYWIIKLLTFGRK